MPVGMGVQAEEYILENWILAAMQVSKGHLGLLLYTETLILLASNLHFGIKPAYDEACTKIASYRLLKAGLFLAFLQQVWNGHFQIALG